jgi:TetR/AcrR family transcriptional regulator, transcriptional repressor for nem operon
MSISSTAKTLDTDMARYSHAHREKTRMAIVEAASKMLRERGFDDTSVVEVMKAVGLTHGGFYAHFEDKAAMLVAALECAFFQSPKNFAILSEMARAKDDAGIIAAKYLSDRQVDDVGDGCPGAALMSEAARQPEAIRIGFASGLRQSARALGPVPASPAEEPASENWSTLALLMGALALIRATPDPETRETIRKQAIAATRTLATRPQSKANRT